MADTVTTQTLVDHQDLVVVHITNQSDGTGESAVTKVDASALTPAATSLSLLKVVGATSGMAVNILFDADTDVLALGIPDGFADEICFKDYPIKNNAGSGVTGDIKVTTSGHSPGDTYSLVLHFRKVRG